MGSIRLWDLASYGLISIRPPSGLIVETNIMDVEEGGKWVVGNASDQCIEVFFKKVIGNEYLEGYDSCRSTSELYHTIKEASRDTYFNREQREYFRQLLDRHFDGLYNLIFLNDLCIKIGRTKNIVNRMINYRTHTLQPFRMCFFPKSLVRSGEFRFKNESQMIQLFKDSDLIDHIRGEHFRPAKNLIKQTEESATLGFDSLYIQSSLVTIALGYPPALCGEN